MEQVILRGGYRKLEEYLRQRRMGKPFLICGKSAEQTDVYEFLSGLGAVHFFGFKPNPIYEDAVGAAKKFRNSGCDCIIGLGGGSAVDVAKCVKLWAGKGIPLIAVPTTAGTGSEATHFAVIYRDGEKTSVADECCLPDAVLLDPSTLKTLPNYHRKASMLDALCHGMESLWSVKATEESRRYASQAIQRVLDNLEDYLKNQPSGNARMLEAAYLAGKAINITQTTAGHAMCYKLTTIYGIAHGHAAALCNAALLPYMIQKAEGTPLADVFRRLAGSMGCDSQESAVGRFASLLITLELQTPIPGSEDYEILKNSVNAERLKNNPIPLNVDEIDMLYHKILGGDSG